MRNSLQPVAGPPRSTGCAPVPRCRRSCSGKTPRPGRRHPGRRPGPGLRGPLVKDLGKVRLKGSTSYTAWAVGFLTPKGDYPGFSVFVSVDG